ncbi:MAG: hypothetical protein KJ697_05140 [Nanoarchaeota archaeon]|nr:hypothetical protein [Nanoarchaeota archaeon]MBU4124415.1 hypothetical protein [Nanoarchaeota archaeon]
MIDAQILGWIATILFSSMLIPQIIKTLKTKTTEGVSLLTYIIFLAGNIIALYYALMIGEAPLQIKYIIALIVTTFFILIFLYYKSKQKEVKI